MINDNLFQAYVDTIDNELCLAKILEGEIAGKSALKKLKEHLNIDLGDDYQAYVEFYEHKKALKMKTVTASKVPKA